MLEPANYVPSNTNYNAVLQKFISFMGTEVLRFGPNGETMNARLINKVKRKIRALKAAAAF
jgi:hypothetical protein